MTLSTTQLNLQKSIIPQWIIWVQCIAFVVLYEFWILPEIVGFRNSALVVGALAGLYSIYQYRSCLVQKRAIPFWLMACLFIWMIFHLFFLAQDSALQQLEFQRIWKYAALGAIFAFGLGLSLANVSNQHQKTLYWRSIYLGLCLPVLTYLIKYALTTYGPSFGFQPPASLQIYFSSQPYYIQKVDYIVFCLPVLAHSLGQIQSLLAAHIGLKRNQIVAISTYLSLIAATLFLFYVQDAKNGMVYSALCMVLFATCLLFKSAPGKFWRNCLFVIIGATLFAVALYPHVQKNHSWRTLIADTKVAFQLDKYQQWKYAGEHGYPNNEFGEVVSITNYERAAWSKVGVQLALQTPLGYGLVEDSFKKMVKTEWPEASIHLSHSHSGWLDIILAVGFPGFLCILGALIGAIVQSGGISSPWKTLVFWALVANLLLWVTTEASATVTFPVLIFWICWACGLTLVPLRRVKSII